MESPGSRSCRSSTRTLGICDPGPIWAGMGSLIVALTDVEGTAGAGAALRSTGQARGQVVRQAGAWEARADLQHPEDAQAGASWHGLAMAACGSMAGPMARRAARRMQGAGVESLVKRLQSFRIIRGITRSIGPGRKEFQSHVARPTSGRNGSRRDAGGIGSRLS